MPKEYLSAEKCACCSSSFNKSQKGTVRTVSSSQVMNRLNNFLKNKKIKIGDLYCNLCKVNSYRANKISLTQNSQIESLKSTQSHPSENLIEQSEQMLKESSFSSLLMKVFKQIKIHQI